MSAPYLDTWNPSAKIAANTALLTALSGGSIKIYNSTDSLLGSVALSDPVGTVDSGTGVLTLTAADDGTWVASGTASYATLFDGSTTPVAMQSLSCQQGTEAVTGKCVLNSLLTTTGTTFALVSWVIP